MANNLGTASLLLTANSSQLTSTLNKTEKDVVGWSTRVGSLLKSSLRVAGIGAAGALAAGLGAIAIVNPFERLADIAKQGDIARVFGVSVEAFTGLSAVMKTAGSDARDQIENFTTFSNVIDQAIEGKSQSAADLFNQLKVPPQVFKDLDAVSRFYLLFDSIAKQPQQNQAGLLGKAVGEEGQKNLILLLGKTSEELKKLGKEYEMSTADMAKAQVAAQQLAMAKAQLNKALDQVAIALTPVIALIAERLPVAIEFCKGVIQRFGPPVITVMRFVAQATAAVADVWNALKSGMVIVVGAIIKSFGYLVHGISKLIEWMQDLGEVLDIDIGFGQAAKDTKAFAEEVKQLGRLTIEDGVIDLNKFGDNQRATLKWFDDLMKDREKRVADAGKKLIPAPWKTQQQQQGTAPGMVAGAVQGSADATKIIQAFNFNAKLKDDIAKQQLGQQMQMKQLLEQIKNAVANGAFLRVI